DEDVENVRQNDRRGEQEAGDPESADRVTATDPDERLTHYGERADRGGVGQHGQERDDGRDTDDLHYRGQSHERQEGEYLPALQVVEKSPKPCQQGCLRSQRFVQVNRRVLSVSSSRYIGL